MIIEIEDLKCGVHPPPEVAGNLATVGQGVAERLPHEAIVATLKTDFQAERPTRSECLGPAEHMLSHLALQLGRPLGAKDGDQPGLALAWFRVARENSQSFAHGRIHQETRTSISYYDAVIAPRQPDPAPAVQP